MLPMWGQRDNSGDLPMMPRLGYPRFNTPQPQPSPQLGTPPPAPQVAPPPMQQPPQPQNFGAQAVRATGGPQMPWAQNLAVNAGGMFQRPPGLGLSFNPFSLNPFANIGAPIGGGNAPTWGMPQTMLGQAMNMSPMFAPWQTRTMDAPNSMGGGYRPAPSLPWGSPTMMGSPINNTMQWGGLFGAPGGPLPGGPTSGPNIGGLGLRM